ncbi:polysaccharide deacetylase family protein [Paenibacillus sp. PL2-23]|uniref:polysaccharide deacetylase family protein n=1 Tax=Paenibacillus sp. PL2-23 TaxID=2100729 RepID=UPI0030FBA207
MSHGAYIRIGIALLIAFTVTSTNLPAAAAPSNLAAAYISTDTASTLQPSKRQTDHKRKKRRSTRKPSPVMSWETLKRQYPNVFLTNGSRSLNRVALTFDDAPDPRFTPAILDVLAQYDVCATFFVVGERAAKHPELVSRIIREGHVIGNHSFDHSVFSKLSMYQFQQQIWKTDGIIQQITGVSPTLIRPPYGELLSKQVSWGKQNGFTIVNWDVDSEDWKRNPDSARVMANIKRTLQPGSIILQHAGGGVGQDLSGTIQALPSLIELLEGKGYELVTLSELINKHPYRN